jgi:hypothetical protein
VRDTRNLLLVKPNIPMGLKDEGSFLASISYALQRGMQVQFEIEEQEIAVERIGQEEDRRLAAAKKSRNAMDNFANAWKQDSWHLHRMPLPVQRLVVGAGIGGVSRFVYIAYVALIR